MTNLAFIIAALVLVFVARRAHALNVEISVLIFLIAAIGIGSGLFHTLATAWAMLADVIPILLFQIGFLIIYSRRVIGLSPVFIFRLLMLFILLTLGFESLPREWLNGSLGYMPAILFLIGFGLYHRKNRKHAPDMLIYAAVTFLISLMFRSMDMWACPSLSIGTHFMWHILNAAVLYMCVLALIKNPKKITP